jgi:hypothetical protein
MTQNENTVKVWAIVPFTTANSGSKGKLSQTSFVWDSPSIYIMKVSGWNASVF